MDSAPGKERPVGAVPHSADDEDHEGVADLFSFGTPAASEGNIKVITKPSGEGNMPAPPKFGDITRKIGKGEVTHEADAEELGTPDGNIGIA